MISNHISEALNFRVFVSKIISSFNYIGDLLYNVLNKTNTMPIVFFFKLEETKIASSSQYITQI